MPITKKVKRTKTKKPSVSLIGPGRLGIALALVLHSAGYEIVALVGRSRPRLRTGAKVLDALARPLVTKVTKVTKGLEDAVIADVIIVAVHDDQIAAVAESLRNIKTPGRPTVLHTSGALSSKVLSSLAKKGWHTGSIHPLASISDPMTGAALLRTAFWCIEGDATATRLGRKIVSDIGGRSFSIDSNNKPLYHAAAVMSSGNMTALFDVALGMLEKCGVSRRNAQNILLPLLESNTLNLTRSVPEDALTGTFARGDIATVQMHLSALEEKDLEEARQLYRLLGKRSLKLVRNRIASEIADEIEKLL